MNGKARTAFFWGVGLLLIGTAAWLIALPFRRPVLVTIRASTEVAHMTLDSVGTRENWFLRNARVRIDTARSRQFTGEFTPASNAKVQFERIGKDTLHILVTGTAGRAAAGRLFDPATEGEFVADSILEIAISQGHERDLVFPYTGRVVLGALVPSQTRAGSPLLLGGKGELIATTIFGRTRFVAGNVDLQLGDQVEIAYGESVPVSVGFVRIDDDPGMRVAMDARGTGVRTRRFGVADALVIEKPFLRFFSEDKWLALLAAGFVLVINELFKEFVTKWGYDQLKTRWQSWRNAQVRKSVAKPD